MKEGSPPQHEALQKEKSQAAQKWKAEWEAKIPQRKMEYRQLKPDPEMPQNKGRGQREDKPQRSKECSMKEGQYYLNPQCILMRPLRSIHTAVTLRPRQSFNAVTKRWNSRLSSSRKSTRFK